MYVVIRTSALGITRYSESQLELFRKVLRARTERGHDYNQIAEILSKQGIKSPTNRPLTGLLLYALYVKRLKTLAARRGTEPEVVYCAIVRTSVRADSHFSTKLVNLSRQEHENL